MPEEVTIREDLQLIQVTSTGQVSEDDFRLSLAAILKIQDERGLARVFVDGSAVTSYPSSFSIYEFGLKASSVLRDTCIAIVASPAVDDDSAFFEDVMRNRGCLVRAFRRHGVALEWLHQMPELRSNGDQSSSCG